MSAAHAPPPLREGMQEASLASTGGAGAVAPGQVCAAAGPARQGVGQQTPPRLLHTAMRGMGMDRCTVRLAPASATSPPHCGLSTLLLAHAEAA
jgi:hypothetical protein